MISSAIIIYIQLSLTFPVQGMGLEYHNGLLDALEASHLRPSDQAGFPELLAEISPNLNQLNANVSPDLISKHILEFEKANFFSSKS